MLYRLLTALIPFACADLPTSGRIDDGAPASMEMPSVADPALAPADLPPGVAELQFGVTPYIDAADIRLQFDPIAEFLSARLRVKVRVVTAPNYDALIEMVVRGEVHLVALSPLSYVTAKGRSPALQLVGSELTSGALHFSSLVLARTEDTKIDSLAALAGKRVAFVDRRSTSGYLYPYAALLAEGIDPVRGISPTFAGTHTAAIRALIDGHVDAACVASEMLGFAQDAARPTERERYDPGHIRVLANVGRIRYDALVLSGNFPASGVLKVQSAFGRLSRRTAEGRRHLQESVRVAGWVSATDADYAPVRDVLARVEAHQRSLSPPAGAPAPLDP